VSDSNPFEFIARRRFLKWTLGVGGLALGGGGAAYASLFGLAPYAGPLEVLTDLEHRTVTNLVTTICGTEAERERRGVAGAFDAFLADEPANIVSDLKNALTWLELGPVLYDRRWQTFSGLSQSDREAHFLSWMESDELLRRKVATAFRKFVNLVTYDNPDVWRRIAYPGPATGLRDA